MLERVIAVLQQPVRALLETILERGAERRGRENMRVFSGPQSNVP
jgi:hypothetical protein